MKAAPVTNLLATIHMWTAYGMFLVVLVSAFLGFGRAKDAREFTAGPYSGAMVLLDITVTLGIVLYVLGSAWNARPEIAYLHPLFAFAALGVGHALLGRARKQRMAVDAHRTAARGLLLALLFVVLAIGVASAPPFLS